MPNFTTIVEKLKAFGRFIKRSVVLFYEEQTGDEDPTIVTDDVGITITKNKRLLGAMRWADMRKVVFHQKDLYTLELIYTGFEDSNGHCCSTDELMRGYQDFCKAADERFPGFKEVEAMFGWNAAGRFSKVEPLWLELQLGHALHMPEDYVTRVPLKSGRIHIPF